MRDYWHSRGVEVFARFLKHIHAQTASGVRCCFESRQCQVMMIRNVGLGGAGTMLLLKQILALMNCGVSSGLDFASHFSVSQLCQECLGRGV